MTDNRKFTASVCVKSGTTRARIELADAARHGGPAGRYRVRVDRRWHCQGDGAAAWLSAADVGALVASLLESGETPEDAPPVLPRGSCVSVPNGRDIAGQPLRDITRTATEPVRGYDGRWLVGVVLMGRGTVMVPVEDCQPR